MLCASAFTRVRCIRTNSATHGRSVEAVEELARRGRMPTFGTSGEDFFVWTASVAGWAHDAAEAKAESYAREQHRAIGRRGVVIAIQSAGVGNLKCPPGWKPKPQGPEEAVYTDPKGLPIEQIRRSTPVAEQLSWIHAAARHFHTDAQTIMHSVTRLPRTKPRSGGRKDAARG